MTPQSKSGLVIVIAVIACIVAASQWGLAQGAGGLVLFVLGMVAANLYNAEAIAEYRAGPGEARRSRRGSAG